MLHRHLLFITGSTLLLTATLASAQGAAALPPPAISSPTYVTASFDVDINRPADSVWARIGKFCNIGEWAPATCSITAGVDDQLGAVRLVRGTIVEMMVGRTAHSYTYTMPVRVGVPYNVFHGTLEVRPLTAATSKVIYSFFYDNSMLADDKARADEIAARRDRTMGFLRNIKTLAEGGTVQSAAPR
jgi:hypothetical protein